MWALRRRSSVLARLAAVSPDDAFVASMTVAELRFGALNSERPAANAARVDAFLEPMDVVPFDTEAAGHHARIRFALKSSPVGERDLVIASVAVAGGFMLVSENRREFSRVAGLRMEGWLEP